MIRRSDQACAVRGGLVGLVLSLVWSVSSSCIEGLDVESGSSETPNLEVLVPLSYELAAHLVLVDDLRSELFADGQSLGGEMPGAVVALPGAVSTAAPPKATWPSRPARQEWRRFGYRLSVGTPVEAIAGEWLFELEMFSAPSRDKVLVKASGRHGAAIGEAGARLDFSLADIAAMDTDSDGMPNITELIAYGASAVQDPSVTPPPRTIDTIVNDAAAFLGRAQNYAPDGVSATSLGPEAADLSPTAAEEEAELGPLGVRIERGGGGQALPACNPLPTLSRDQPARPVRERDRDEDERDPGGIERFIVVLHDKADPEAMARDHTRRFGGRLIGRVLQRVFKGYVIEIERERISELVQDADVQFVSPNLPESFEDASDPARYPEKPSNGLKRVGGAGLTATGGGIGLAVLDSGVDVDHPDLRVAGGWSCEEEDEADPEDYDDTLDRAQGHGTHVAGIIAALSNGYGAVGIAPDARLFAVQTCGTEGWVRAMEWIDKRSTGRREVPLAERIKVLNMSVSAEGNDTGNCGQDGDGDGLGDAVHYAVCSLVRDGVVVVAAAGNQGQDLAGNERQPGRIPAAYDEVISVTNLVDADGRPCGIGGDDVPSPSSNWASGADLGHVLAAPGESVYSTLPLELGAYGLRSGTSMASPLVAGAVALYLYDHPRASPAEVLSALRAAGERPGENYGAECPAGVSHRDTSPGARHAEPLLRLGRSLDTGAPAGPGSPLQGCAQEPN